MTASAAYEALDVDALLARANVDAGANGAIASTRRRLERLTAALVAEAALTDSGASAAASALVSAAATQWQLRRLEAERPEIAGQAIPTVVFVTGMHRTGTTLLQNLLAEHPAIRAPRLWELMSPVSDRDPRVYERLIARTTSYVDEYYRVAPGFRAIHPLDARRPEECHRLTAATFLSEIYALRYRVPSYLDWLADQDHREAYGFHRSALKAILWRIPGGSAVALKCPFHLWHGPELAETYPYARVVLLHRDPAVTIASACSLTMVIRAARAIRVDAAEIGSFWLDRTQSAIATLMAGGGGDFSGRPVLDVRYPDLVRDPVAVARDVCEFVGVPFTAAAERRMRDYLTANAAGSHGVHRYRAEDFGLSTSALDRRFAEYRARFRL